MSVPVLSTADGNGCQNQSFTV